MSDYPAAITTVNHVAPVPRRIRAFLGGEQIVDTSRALYVWEWPPYPQYYIPLADVRQDLVSGLELGAEARVGQRLGHDRFHGDGLFLGHVQASPFTWRSRRAKTSSGLPSPSTERSAPRCA